MIGVYDEDRGYRWYQTVEGFFRRELTHNSRGRWFFAHAGGMADILFFLEKLVSDERFSVSASFSGSSAIIVHIRRGKHSWHFCDSLWLFRDNLRNIGKAVGIQKGNEEGGVDFYRDASIEELVPYNRTDCLILYTAIARFQQYLLELGGELRMTIASCGLTLFRRRFLPEEIETCSEVNDITRLAYFASRVEVLNTRCDDALYYDINSSFPFSMTKPLPGEFTGSCDTLPDSGIYFARVSVTVPEMYLPPLPRRVHGRLFFPTGSWEGWYCNVDLELLEKSGGKIDRVHEVMCFAEQTHFRNYVETIWAHRQTAEGFDRVADKYLLNCVYGKMAELPDKTRLLLRPSTPGAIDDQIAPGMFLEDFKAAVPHVHVPISAYVTALSRKILYEYMIESPELHYCDTDGFSTTREYPTGKKLGELKLEKLIRNGKFVAPKIYGLEGTDDEGKPIGGYDDEGKALGLYRAKGFSKVNAEVFAKLTEDIPEGGLTYLELEEIASREEVTFVRMKRLREMIRKGELKPSEATIKKKLRAGIPKRFIYPDGYTRPWQINELE